MRIRNPSLARVLFVLSVLIVGPLQAHTVFHCAMMDEVMLECCCIASASNEDGEEALDSKDDLCCERLLAIAYDVEASQDTLIAKPAEVRSDVDPPSSIAVNISEYDLLSWRAEQRGNYRSTKFSQSASKTYLVTQRLRI